MHSFKDSKGRLWTVTINVATLKRVKATNNVNLAELSDGEDKNPLAPVGEFLQDTFAFVDTLCVILKPEMDKLGVTPEDFFECLDGDALFSAGEAFARAYVDFFHGEKARKSLHKALDKSQEVAVKLLEKANRTLDQMDAADEAEKIATSLTRQSGTAPESSGLTPAPSLSPSLSA